MKIKTENRLVLCVRKRDNFDEESQEQQKPAYIEPKEKNKWWNDDGMEKTNTHMMY